jgi:hypothetical protein
MQDEDKQFRIKGFLYPQSKTASHKPQIGWQEPVQAVDAAESWLNRQGIKGQSFVEIYFNGSNRPVCVVRYLNAPDQFGIWNSFDNAWPITYMDEKGGQNLSELGISPDRPWLDPEWDGDEDEDDESDSESEGRKPRVKLFARARHGARRRKRFESDLDLTRNVFEFIVGKLDLGTRKPRIQERDHRVEVRAVEIDNGGDTGQHLNLFVNLPAGSVVEVDEGSHRVKIKVLDIPLDVQ